MAEIILPRIIKDGETPAGSRKWLRNFNQAAYHSEREAVNQGALVTLDDFTPAHFAEEWSKPYVASYGSPAMWIGTLVHMAVLEPDRYAKRIVKPKFGDMRTKIGKQAKIDWLSSLPLEMIALDENGVPVDTKPGSLVVSEEEKHQVESMAMALISHPKLSGIMKHEACEREVTVYWPDSRTGVYCRARLDVVSTLGSVRVIVDVKTVESARDDDFNRTIENGRYHVQGDHYVDAGNAVEPGAFTDYLFAVVERNPPHCARVRLLSEAALSRGRAIRSRALEKLARCIETNNFPGYDESIDVVDLPPWAYSKNAAKDDTW